MAFDGIVVSALVRELNDRLTGGRVMKVAQPEKDELIFTIKNYEQMRLLISADAGLPLVYLTETVKESPLTSPAFCMLLRKHLQSAKLLSVSQPGLERIIYFDFEHLDDMGDLKKKRLIMELMGKHSNIILCDDQGVIIDSIKRIPSSVSSVREVLPGREYFATDTMHKHDPLTTGSESFADIIRGSNTTISRSLYMCFTGISPMMANEVVYRAGIDPDLNSNAIEDDMLTHLYKTFERLMEDIGNGSFTPNIVDIDGEPEEFGAVRLTLTESRPGAEVRNFGSVSAMLEDFYERRNLVSRIHQRSADMSKVVSNAIARAVKKYELQNKQLEDTEKRDKYRIWGELLTTYGYMVNEGDKSVTVNNYYDGEDITIPLDPQLNAIDNAKAYFDKYAKLKRTNAALTKYIEESRQELEHLESVRLSLSLAEHEEDLETIREELAQFGYMKRPSVKGRKTGGRKSGRRTSEPIVYETEEGFKIIVGKNNFQNDEITFKLATGGDWWFHAKGCPGSHVVLKSEGKEVPDAVFEKAAGVAAYYSKNRDNDKVEVDYLQRKNVKKPNGAKPGFVVYYTNYSMVAQPGIGGLKTGE